MPTDVSNPKAATMSFGDHLEELRRRLLYAIAAPLPLFIVIFPFSDKIIGWLLLPVYKVLLANDLPAELQVLSPPEFILAELKISVISAVVISAPWILWQGWQFVAPGLYQQERRFVYFLIPGSALLTIAGVALLYYVMLPLMMHVLVMFAVNADVGATPPEREERITAALAAAGAVDVLAAPPAAPAVGDAWLLVPEMTLQMALLDEEGAVETIDVPPLPRTGIEQKFRVSFVVNFTLVLLLGIVIAFQMPLVILLLGWLDIASIAWLRSHRRYALAICGVISAIITPADAVSMLIMLVPLYALYELGILLLIIAPAKVVAEGRFGVRKRSKSRPSDKPRDPGSSA